MNGLKKHIPNFITSLNLFSGSVAVIFAIDGHLIWAGVFICLAALFDFLDGFTARLLKAFSPTGKQLDSLADLVSFGLAPGAILFTLLEFSLFEKNQPVHEISARWTDWMLLFSAFLLPVFGALRLARFNISPGNDHFFRGLPIPANGLFWASLGLMLEMPGHYQQVLKLVFSTPNLVIFGLFFSGMMVISLPMFSMKFKDFNLKNNWFRYLFLALTAVFIAVFHVYGIALTIFSYIFLNILFYLAGVKY